MTERDRGEPLPYWHLDEQLGDVVLFGESWSLRLAAHLADEPYQRGHAELVPLTAPGTRSYVHARPYILVPDIRVSIALSEAPDPGGSIGSVTGSQWDGMKAEAIGKAQAWSYQTSPRPPLHIFAVEVVVAQPTSSRPSRVLHSTQQRTVVRLSGYGRRRNYLGGT